MTGAVQWLGHIVLTSLGFFWKAGWAFVMGYAISGMIAGRERRQLHRGRGVHVRLDQPGHRTRHPDPDLPGLAIPPDRTAGRPDPDGFTVAGAVAVPVPDTLWQAIFLGNVGSAVPTWLRVLENAAIAPFVAAATFIGSMGNIPLATVLGSNGVLFAGMLGFIYSDLMVPPLVMINARYYGWRVALYIAAVMYISIVCTALLMHAGFGALHLTPQSSREVGDVSRFAVDYTFYLNIAFAVIAGVLVWLHRRYIGRTDVESMSSGGAIKRWIAYGCVVLLLAGLGVAVLHL